MLKTLHSAHGTRQVHLGGWKKQHVDARDEGFRIKLHPSFLSPGAAPSSCDNRPVCSPMENQGDLGSCTAHMLAALVEANEIKRQQQGKTAASVLPSLAISNVAVSPAGIITFTTSVTPAATPAPVPTPAPKLVRASRLFQYYGTRKIENTITQDSGASIRDAIKCAALYGVADEALWPYDISKFTLNPPAPVWTQAATHKVTSYHAITDGDITTMKTALAAGWLVGFGFAVYDFMLSREMARNGLLPKPLKTESLQGGHAVALVGYDDNMMIPRGDGTTAKGAFLVRNSWGLGWGYQGTGYFWMSYEYVGDTNLSNDFWVVQSAPI